MNITDPIADLLTRIRNASQAKHATVDIPVSNITNRVLLQSHLNIQKQAHQ